MFDTEYHPSGKSNFSFHFGVDTQAARNVSGTSPEGPLKVLTFRTYRKPSGDSQGTNTNIDDLINKNDF